MANLLPVKEAAKRLSVTTRFLYKLKSKNELDFHYLGARVFIDMDALEAKILLNTKTNSHEQVA